MKIPGLLAVSAVLLGLWGWARRPRTPPPGLAASQPFLDGLLPEVAWRAHQLLVDAWQDGIALVITSGYRSLAEQAALYAQGRTLPGPIVTDAPPGWSWHNHRRAFDVAVRDASGRATWPPSSSPLWISIGRRGRALGLDWGRDFGDDPHFDYHPGLRIEDLAHLTA